MRRTAVGLDCRSRAGRIQGCGKTAHGGVGVNVAHRQMQRGRIVTHLGAEPRHQQRMSAVFVEEVAVDRYRIQTERLLQRGAKGALGLRRRRRVAFRNSDASGFRRGQLFAIGLVADQRRDERQTLEIGRRHVGRKALAQRRKDGRRLRRLGAMLDGIIGHKLGVAGLRLESRDHDLRDLGNIEQHRLDLGQFDAIAAQLHLRIDAAEIFNFAFGVDAAEVAGPINAARWIVGQREEVLDELGLGEFTAVQIALGDANARDAYLAAFAHRQGLIALGVENDNRIGRKRTADRDGFLRGHSPQRRGDGGLCRSVAVQQGAVWARPALDQSWRTGFAADQKDAQRRQVAVD